MIDYPEIDFTGSFEKLRQAIVRYNEQLQEQYPQSYKSRTLKSGHMETAKEIIRFYGAYLYKNMNFGLNPDRRFWVTNGGLAGKKLQHRTTIYRHIERLCEAGIILEKIWHGSSCGIELRLNPEVLYFRVEAEKKLSNGHSTLVSEKEKIGTKGKSNNHVAFCRNKDSRPVEEYFNINSRSLFVDNPGRMTNQNEGDCIQEPFYRKQGNLALEREQGHKPQTPKGADRTENTGGSWRGPAIGKLTESAWKFAKGLLWKDKDFSTSETELGKKYLREYFEAIPGQKFLRLANPLFIAFCERILLAKKYVDRNPARYIPVPSKWFDQHFAWGFAGTKHWHTKLRENRKKNKAKYEELRKLVFEYQKLTLFPSVKNYKDSEKALKGSNPELLQFFNACVLDPTKFQPEHLHTYYEA